MDRDTLARDLLTLLADAPAEVVRGLVLVDPDGRRFPVRVARPGLGWGLVVRSGTPADLHAAGWSVDLRSDATGGVLLGILAKKVGGMGRALVKVSAVLDHLWDDEDRAEDPTLAEAAAIAVWQAHHNP